MYANLKTTKFIPRFKMSIKWPLYCIYRCTSYLWQCLFLKCIIFSWESKKQPAFLKRPSVPIWKMATIFMLKRVPSSLCIWLLVYCLYTAAIWHRNKKQLCGNRKNIIVSSKAFKMLCMHVVVFVCSLLFFFINFLHFKSTLYQLHEPSTIFCRKKHTNIE